MAHSFPKSLGRNIWIVRCCTYRSYPRYHSNGREVNYNSPEGKNNITHNTKLYKKHEELLSNMPMDSTREGVLGVYDRITALKDEDDDNYCLELSGFAGFKMPYGNVPCGNTVTMITRVSGNPCIITANNGSFKGGTMYPVSVKKNLRAQDIAQRNRIPCIYLVDSGGAYLPLQAEIFAGHNHGGRTFRNQAVLSSMGIPQITLVCGPCTAGGAYVPTMSDEAGIVHKLGTLYLAGPPLVKAATGESVSQEDLGGARVHCSISGCTDHYAGTESDGLAIIRSIMANLNMKKHSLQTSVPTQSPRLGHSLEDFATLIPHDNPHQLPIMEVISRIFDGSEFQSFKECYGTRLVTGFARLLGRTVGVVANDGVLGCEEALKGTHFVRMCSVRDIPLIFLQNTPPDDEFLSAYGNDGITVKARAQMIAAVACSQVPKLTVILGGGYGPSYYAMCGAALEPNFLFTWPHARVAIGNPSDVASAITHQSEAYDDKDVERIIERLRLEEDSYSYSQEVYDDGMILPHQTRQVLSFCLDVCLTYRDDSKSRFDRYLCMDPQKSVLKRTTFVKDYPV